MVKSPLPGVNDDVTDDTPFEALSEKSLKAAGYAYLVGDAALFASGRLAGRNNEANAGLLYTVGGLACARYGNPTAEKQLKLMGAELGKYLRDQHITIPKEPSTEILNQPGGVINNIETFLYKYPSQLLNATYAMGGVQLLRSGMQHGKKWDTASGALVAAGGLAGLLIQERAPDPERPATGMIGKAVAWIQEKPLRAPGILYALNNATLIMSALGERKTNPGQKSYLFKFLTAGSYIFGNTMLAMSSKHNHGGGETGKEALEKLADTSARVITAQAPELQEALVQNIAGYLSAQPEVHMKASEFSDMLHAKLKAVSVGAPSANTAMDGWVKHLYDQNGAMISPSL